MTEAAGDTPETDTDIFISSVNYFPFGASGTKAAQDAISFYKLPFNRLQGLEESTYRLLTTNYRLENGLIKSERYKQFSLPTGEKIKNFLFFIFLLNSIIVI